LNGKLVKAVRAPEPTNKNLNFGILAEVDKATASSPAVQIKGYAVTAGK
jgi:hypothetical protein